MLVEKSAIISRLCLFSLYTEQIVSSVAVISWSFRRFYLILGHAHSYNSVSPLHAPRCDLISLSLSFCVRAGQYFCGRRAGEGSWWHRVCEEVTGRTWRVDRQHGSSRFSYAKIYLNYNIRTDLASLWLPWWFSCPVYLAIRCVSQFFFIYFCGRIQIKSIESLRHHSDVSQMCNFLNVSIGPKIFNFGQYYHSVDISCTVSVHLK